VNPPLFLQIKNYTPFKMSDEKNDVIKQKKIENDILYNK